SRVLGRFVVDAVAQEPEVLEQLAAQLASLGRIDDSVVACTRAAELASASESALAACARMALDARAPKLLLAMGQALAAEASEPRSFALAGQALAAAGQRPAALEIVDRGLRAHGNDAGLVMTAAQLRLDGGDLAGAKAKLMAHSDSAWSLAERRQAA